MTDLLPVTAEDALIELRRERKMREFVFPRRVENGSMTAERAAKQNAGLDKAIEIVQAVVKVEEEYGGASTAEQVDERPSG